MLYLSDEQRHLLPRPLSIFNVSRQKGELVLFFMIRGQGTALLAKSDPGSCRQLLGPLGNGFPPLPARSLLVGGGIGVAPLVFLAASTHTPRTLIYGASRADLLNCPFADLDLPGLTVLETTEDGSRGSKGTAVDLASSVLSGFRSLYACGPRPMLARLAKLSHDYEVAAWVSLEEKMACGIGACLGCAVKGRESYNKVCSDGPVFPAGEVFL